MFHDFPSTWQHFSRVQTSQASLRQPWLPRSCIAGTFTLTLWTTRLTKWHKGFLKFSFMAVEKSTSGFKVLYKTTRKKNKKGRVRRALAVSKYGNKKCTGDVMSRWIWKKRASVSQTLAALEFVALLPISGWWDTNIHYIVAWRLVVCRSVRYLLLWHDTVDFCRGKSKEKDCNALFISLYM